jgi:excisionase family DNA binding protein
MSVPDAAKFLGLSRASAYRYAEAGQLPIKRFGRRVYVVRALLTELLTNTSTTEADAA